MNNNLPQKENDNIINKLIKKIRCIFFKADSIAEVAFENNEIEKHNTEENIEKFSEKYKVSNSDGDKEQQQKEFISTIEKNPQLLKKFDLDKLKIISKYYSNEISKIDKEIEALRQKRKLV